MTNHRALIAVLVVGAAACGGGPAAPLSQQGSTPSSATAEPSTSTRPPTAPPTTSTTTRAATTTTAQRQPPKLTPHGTYEWSVRTVPAEPKAGDDVFFDITVTVAHGQPMRLSHIDHGDTVNPDQHPARAGSRPGPPPPDARYSWSSREMSPDSDRVVHHTYAKRGRYTATIEMDSQTGDSATYEFSVR